jgi:hypothetical protein
VSTSRGPCFISPDAAAADAAADAAAAAVVAESADADAVDVDAEDAEDAAAAAGVAAAVAAGDGVCLGVGAGPGAELKLSGLRNFIVFGPGRSVSIRPLSYVCGRCGLLRHRSMERKTASSVKCRMSGARHQ